MRLLLVGHTGYIGSMLHEQLLPKYTMDCVHYSQLHTIQLSLYDVILYMSGLSDPSLDETIILQENCIAFSNFLKSLDNQLVIYASTGAVYTRNPNVYTRSMLARENAASRHRSVGLRFGSIAGVTSRRPRISSIFNGVYNQAFEFKRIRVWNTESRRTILWKDDLVAFVGRLIERRDQIQTATVVNVGSFTATIGEIASFISDKTGSTLDVLPSTETDAGFTMELDAMNGISTGTLETIHKDYMSNKETFLYNVRQSCIVCKTSPLHSVITIGMQPLSNELTPSKRKLPSYPLHLLRCPSCFHTQLSYLVNRSRLFEHYLYESGVSSTIKQYFRDFAEHYTRVCAGSRILELACNDGSQLDEFKRLGWKTYGVDPAKNIVERCFDKGHDVDTTFWGVDPTKFDSDQFDLIVAQNVIAHVPDPVQFLRACARVMHASSLLVVQTSQCEMILNNEFDTIYHEHVSFFTARSMVTAANRVGLVVVNARKEPIHGTSYVFELRLGTDQSTLALMMDEEKLGLYGSDVYRSYALSVQHTKDRVLQKLAEYNRTGYTIIGYGAAAKGNVFLNYIFDSSPNPLAPQFIVDDSALKQGLYTPGTQIEIVDNSRLNEVRDKPVCVIILAWNFADAILQTIRRLCPTAVCIQFYPTLCEHTCVEAMLQEPDDSQVDPAM